MFACTFFLRKVIYLAARDTVALGEKLSVGYINRPDTTGRNFKFVLPEYFNKVILSDHIRKF